MQNKKANIRKTVILLLAVVALILGLYCAQIVFSKSSEYPESNKVGYKFDKSQFNGTLLDSPRLINAFNLTGVDGVAFNNASLLGQWTFVFFGFTNCGYMCPTTMAELGKTYRLLQEKRAYSLPQVVMISLDPSRDSADKLGKYVKAFDSHFYGARGDDIEIRAMTNELGIAYAKLQLKTNDSSKDDIEHTGAIMLFNPEGKLTAFFTNPHSAANIANDFLLLTQNSG